MTCDVEVAGRTRRVEVRGRDWFLDGRHVQVDAVRAGLGWSFIVGLESYDVAVNEVGAGELMVHVNGRPVAVRSSRYRPGAARADVTRDGPQRVMAPMPGRIVKVLVAVGDVIAAGQGLVVVEAMKMENELRSLRAGTVTEVRAVEGALVDANAVLVVVVQ